MTSSLPTNSLGFKFCSSSRPRCLRIPMKSSLPLVLTTKPPVSLHLSWPVACQKQPQPRFTASDYGGVPPATACDDDHHDGGGEALTMVDKKAKRKRRRRRSRSFRCVYRPSSPGWYTVLFLLIGFFLNRPIGRQVRNLFAMIGTRASEVVSLFFVVILFWALVMTMILPHYIFVPILSRALNLILSLFTVTPKVIQCEFDLPSSKNHDCDTEEHRASIPSSERGFNTGKRVLSRHEINAREAEVEALRKQERKDIIIKVIGAIVGLFFLFVMLHVIMITY